MFGWYGNGSQLKKARLFHVSPCIFKLKSAKLIVARSFFESLLDIVPNSSLSKIFAFKFGKNLSEKA